MNAILDEKINTRDEQLKNLKLFISNTFDYLAEENFKLQCSYTIDFCYERDLNKLVANPYRSFNEFMYFGDKDEMKKNSQYGGFPCVDYGSLTRQAVDISLLSKDDEKEIFAFLRQKGISVSTIENVLHAEGWMKFSNHKTYTVYVLEADPETYLKGMI